MSSAEKIYLPDSRYAWVRLVSALAVGTLCSAGMWSVVVVLPTVQAEFGTERAMASLPYTLMMCGFAVGTIVVGRLADRFGLVVPVIISAVFLAAGYVVAGMAPSLTVFALAHGLLIGPGAGAGFAPLMADLSHWFIKRRGVAVVLAACGSYFAGVLWPLAMKTAIPLIGWRMTHVAIGAILLAGMLPLTLMFRPRVSHETLSAAETATAAARADLGISPNQLQVLLTVAGFACCMAMAMPQVHIVAYCGDLGYGVASGTEMLALMLGLGIISRVSSGFLADKVGGAATLALGSLMQGAALLLYLFFNGLTSLYVISGIFGLFQGGIVPMYAVISREFLPPREAGMRIGVIITSTIIGMAAGGYVSGLIFDYTASYRAAFLHGIAWNLVNLALACWLVVRQRRAKALKSRAFAV